MQKLLHGEKFRAVPDRILLIDSLLSATDERAENVSLLVAPYFDLVTFPFASAIPIVLPDDINKASE
jgi:hypothetical protein